MVDGNENGGAGPLNGHTERDRVLSPIRSLRSYVGARLRERLLRVITAVLGASLLGIALMTMVLQSRHAADSDLDHALESEAAANAAALVEYFDRAQSIDLLLAHDAALEDLTVRQRTGFPPGAVAAATSRAGRALAYLEQLYPERISEACLIDNTGTELARVVKGVVAPASQLSSKEAGNPFFAPTLQLSRGRVYQAMPYRSPDTGEWVISNSTPMVDSAGRPWGMVHFEVSLASFRLSTGSSRQAFSASVADSRTGRILIESGRVVGATELGRAGPGDLAAAVARTTTIGSALVNGHRTAVARVAVGPDNANTWSVVISAPSAAVVWWRSIGLAPVAAALAALALLAFAGLNLRANHRRLRQASRTDALTGLPNRRFLSDRLMQALKAAERRGASCGVLLIDLDRFKEVNDTLGHHHGDLLLCAVAARLQGAFRGSDTVARLGGDEFAVLLPEVIDEAAALVLAQRCVTALDKPFMIEGIALNVEASIGLALAPQHGQDGNALFRAADVAMYEAKDRKSGVVVYDADADTNTPTRLALLGDLRHALQNDELYMHYQPKVDLTTDVIRGVEALVRWKHPTRGLIGPADFIPVAEGTGLILPITLLTLDKAIAQARQWLDLGTPLQVAVNLSPRCLLAPDFATAVGQQLHRHRLPAHLLRLEITEGAIMADPAKALAVLTMLQQAGVSLSIDDFGTGYSSMSYLKRLPVNELKIDRSFITDMLANVGDDTLVRSSIDLGHNLGLSVVAEGVEDEATLDALTALGCDVVQGYHLGKPMTPDDLNAWLTARNPRELSVPRLGSSA
jgi:diguanylate cyclase (GGDEF)-like protein